MSERRSPSERPQIITTPWGSRQVQVDGLPMLTREQEIELRQEWRTPPEFWEVLNAEFAFQRDAAASRSNALTNSWLDKGVDALSPSAQWIGYSETLRAYCNPGFSDMRPWIEKAISEADRSPSGIVAVLGLCAVSTGWWRMAEAHASEIRLIAPRIQFTPPDPRIPRSSNARENALFIFRGSAPTHGARIETWRWDR